MQTDWLTDAATWVSSWPEGLWRASWQGALCAGVVWAVTRLWPRMPASLRAGLWWLVALKFVVSLMGPRPLLLPVLPPELASGAASSASEREPLSAPWREAGDTARSRGGSRVEGSLQVSNPGGARIAEDFGGERRLEVRQVRMVHVAPAPKRSVAWGQVLTLALLVAWGLGVGWQVSGQVRSWTLMRRLRRGARPLEHAELESQVRELSSMAGLRRAPALLVSDAVASPLATGLLSPVVVLPAKAVRRLPVEGLRMALAHEVAHLRRGDLWLGWVPALAESLLFFHPLARRAAREYALAREEACDAEALRLTGAEPADYGELLLVFGVARPHGTAAALGASAHVHALHRRLSMLEYVDIGSSRPRRLLKVALSALGLAALVPFQVVARQAAEAEATPAVTAEAAPATRASEASRKGAASAGTHADDAKAPSPVRKQGTVRILGADSGTAAAPVMSPAPAAPREVVAPSAPAAPREVVAPSAPVAPREVVAPSAPRVAVVPATPPAPAAPRVAMAPPAPRVSVTPAPAAPHVAVAPAAPMAPPAPVAPAMMAVASSPVSPSRPVPSLPMLAMAGAPPAAPRPPKPPSPRVADDDSGYVLLSGNQATMNGSTVDLELARMFKDKNGGELLYVRRKGEVFIIRDAATLKSVQAALAPIRERAKEQGALGARMGALGGEQGKLGEKQGAIGMKQGALGLKHAELAHQQAGLSLESMRLDSLPEADRARRQAELDKQEAALEKEMDALARQQEELGQQQEVLGREQEKLGQQQEALGREQEKLGGLHEAQVHEAERKIQSLIDEALSKGLGQPLPT